MRDQVNGAMGGEVELYEKERAHRMARKLGLHIVSSSGRPRPQDDPQPGGRAADEQDPQAPPDPEIDWHSSDPG